MTAITTERANEIINEEGMGFDAVGALQCLTINDIGDLTDGDARETADITSEDAFRAQVRRWKAAVA